MLRETEERMPQYECHKKVRALKIKTIANPNDVMPGEAEDDRVLTFSDERYENRFWVVRGAWLAKHEPQVGGYFVLYEDGYTSFSPAAAFESGYTRVLKAES